MKLRYRAREDCIETTIRLPPAKRTIDPRVVDLRASVLVLLDRQFLPPSTDTPCRATLKCNKRVYARTASALDRGSLRSGGVRQIAGTARGSTPSECPAIARFSPFWSPRKRDRRSAQAVEPKSRNTKTLQADPVTSKTRNQ